MVFVARAKGRCRNDSARKQYHDNQYDRLHAILLEQIAVRDLPFDASGLSVKREKLGHNIEKSV